MVKIMRYVLVLFITCASLFSCYFANDIDMEVEDKIMNMVEFPNNGDISDESQVSDDIEAIIEKIENLAAHAEKTIKESIVPIEYTEKLYSKMDEAVEELVDLTNKTTNVYKFLNTKGIERVALPNIGIHYAPLKRQILLLIKNLFEIAPISTNAAIPIGIVDKILDIFEYDDNLALKAYALDVLLLWLPGNPMIQTRVMKMKGLEPFYKQVAKLDASVINQLLELFNKILEEHINARKINIQRSKADHDRVVIYQRIGLLERLSMPNVCNGLLNIFETISTFNTMKKEISLSIFKVIKNVKPYCISVYKTKPRQTNLFNDLLKYVEDPEKSGYLEKLGLNITDTRIVLREYTDIFNAVSLKEEL